MSGQWFGTVSYIRSVHLASLCLYTGVPNHPFGTLFGPLLFELYHLIWTPFWTLFGPFGTIGIGGCTGCYYGLNGDYLGSFRGGV